MKIIYEIKILDKFFFIKDQNFLILEKKEKKNEN